MLMTLAGLGFSIPSTGMPAAQRMPAMMSPSLPKHLPSTRTGSTRTPGAAPAIPAAGLVLVAAATNADVDVPCQLLPETSQSLKVEPALSADVTQSPGSLGSASRPSPSLATTAWLTMSYPGSNWPPLATRPRSGCSKRTPVSSTATTTLALPVVRAQAASMWMADLMVLSGARRYHWPLSGPFGRKALVEAAYSGSLGAATLYLRPLGTA